MAQAESKARDSGMYFEWSLDGSDSSEWTDDRNPPTPTWKCVAHNSAGKVVASLCGIDFGNGEPWGQPYKRVVEAELACDSV